MTTLDDREKGFERQFARDAEREFKAQARRNRMLGEWAARLMGLRNVADYANAVVRSEVDHPGDETVIRKVSQDLTGAGLAMREPDVRAKMDEFMAQARAEVAASNSAE
ncbi:MAG TPA: DUF1476 domain-containing protein [Caulobacteraceae bacterium]|nr:DUF1476 domain-containing protein [Caulobacteraceae bacterium]